MAKGRYIAVVLALVLLATVPAMPAAAHHYKPIQPGGLLGNVCTLNFVFESPDGSLYIGAAAHCVPDVGGRVIAPGLGEFGTVVFSEDMNVSKIAQGEQVFEFALIKIDPDQYDQVEPAHRYWGGPTGIAGDVAEGTPTLHYGQGLYWHYLEASRSRVGVFQYTETEGPFNDWWHGTYPLMGGDSGSGVMTADGKALGMVQLVAITAAPYDVQPAAVSGPTFAFVLDRLAEGGFPVELVTADFDPALGPESIQARAAETLAHCQASPVASIDDPNGCVRPKYFSYREVSPKRPKANWTGSGYWLAMANPSQEACPVGSWAPTLYVRLCDQSVLIVTLPEGYWSSHDGGLEVTLEWPDSADNLDMVIRDADDRVVASSDADTGTSERVFLEGIASGHYLVQVNAAPAVEANFTLRADLSAESTLPVAEDRGSPSQDSEGFAAGLPSVLVLLALAFVSWMRRTRPT